jgi:FO synthase
VLTIAREGAALGCKQAMFTLDDKIEDRWRQVRGWLDAHGYDDTLSCVRATVIRVLEETGLLTHLNPASCPGRTSSASSRPSHGHDA